MGGKPIEKSSSCFQFPNGNLIIVFAWHLKTAEVYHFTLTNKFLSQEATRDQALICTSFIHYCVRIVYYKMIPNHLFDPQAEEIILK